MTLVLALSVLPMLQSASFITSSFSVARFANSERKRRREGGKRKRRDRVHAQPATFCCNFSCVCLFVCRCCCLSSPSHGSWPQILYSTWKERSTTSGRWVTCFHHQWLRQREWKEERKRGWIDGEGRGGRERKEGRENCLSFVQFLLYWQKYV